MSSNSNASGGTSISMVLFLIFLVLKLTGQIDWSWWWVTSPLWIGAGIFVAIFGVLFLLALGAELYPEKKVPKRYDEIDGGWK